MFRPDDWGTFAFPITGVIWRLRSKACDFRVTHNESAMVPRDGPWFSKWEVALSAGGRFRRHRLDEPPLHRRGNLRLSSIVAVAPHFVIRFGNDGILKKISFRPWNGEGSGWDLGAYDSAVFTCARKLAVPLMFYTPREILNDAAYTEHAKPTPHEAEEGNNWDAWRDWDYGTSGWHANDVGGTGPPAKTIPAHDSDIPSFVTAGEPSVEATAPKSESVVSAGDSRISLGPMLATPPPAPLIYLIRV